jgi:hypothetical protein
LSFGVEIEYPYALKNALLIACFMRLRLLLSVFKLPDLTERHPLHMISI